MTLEGSRKTIDDTIRYTDVLGAVFQMGTLLGSHTHTTDTTMTTTKTMTITITMTMTTDECDDDDRQ